MYYVHTELLTTANRKTEFYWEYIVLFHLIVLLCNCAHFCCVQKQNSFWFAYQHQHKQRWHLQFLSEIWKVQTCNLRAFIWESRFEKFQTYNLTFNCNPTIVVLIIVIIFIIIIIIIIENTATRNYEWIVKLDKWTQISEERFTKPRLHFRAVLFAMCGAGGFQYRGTRTPSCRCRFEAGHNEDELGRGCSTSGWNLRLAVERGEGSGIAEAMQSGESGVGSGCALSTAASSLQSGLRGAARLSLSERCYFFQ
jgi:hypothetical protein